ncbi:MAG: recombinase family protein [Methanomassiliicoccales archaeon]|nr:recombinase family protein [Methanomassiliicoccales archaeon]
MPKVAIYTRVSTEDQAKEGYSLAAQKERLEAYCDAQGWDVVEHYVDEGQSGRNTRRPAYHRMIEERDKWDIILVMKMDRIHRNSKNFMMMMENLEKWGKKFSSMSESLDTSNAVGRFVVDIIQRIAQLESEQIGERTYMGMRQKAESGQGLLGFRVPFGYHILEGKLVQDEIEAQVVRSIYDQYLAGQTMDMIAYGLNRESVTTRGESHWTVWSISRILHNPVYAGHLRWDDLVIPSDHQPIISIGIFNQTQRKVASRIKNKKHGSMVQLLPRVEPLVDGVPPNGVDI